MIVLTVFALLSTVVISTTETTDTEIETTRAGTIFEDNPHAAFGLRSAEELDMEATAFLQNPEFSIIWVARWYYRQWRTFTSCVCN
ncbi:MAG: hypothetical protein FWE34_07440 [Defluviitaleaceae bacterium]|nr:hypothetical protein [Defluviitaleaceae bacterium]